MPSTATLITPDFLICSQVLASATLTNITQANNRQELITFFKLMKSPLDNKPR